MKLLKILGLSLLSLGSAATAKPPGTLISVDPVVDTPGGMQAWRIRYWTSDGSGRPREVAGMVVAPREAIPARPRNVLAWTHGTSGVATRCAMSTNPLFWTVTPGLAAVRQGYVVVAPDYPGLGSGGVHPYLVGQDTGRSVLDAVRAARSIPGAASGNRFAVWGESQGGHAALWTGQIARTYAPDLQLVGVAAAAPTTDLVENVRQVPNKSVGAFMTAFIADSWSKHYRAPLSTLGGPQTQGIITRLAQNNCIELEQKPKIGMMLGIMTLQSRLKNKDLGAIQPWARLARANSTSPISYNVPFLIAQNPKDDLVAPNVTRAYAKALCRSGRGCVTYRSRGRVMRPVPKTVRARHCRGSRIVLPANPRKVIAGGFERPSLVCFGSKADGPLKVESGLPAMGGKPILAQCVANRPRSSY